MRQPPKADRRIDRLLGGWIGQETAGMLARAERPARKRPKMAGHRPKQPKSEFKEGPPETFERSLQQLSEITGV